MEIRLAEERDLIDIYALGFDSYIEKDLKSYNTTINRAKARISVASSVESKATYLAIENNCLIGAMIGNVLPCAFSDDIIYVSMFFFVNKEYRSFTKRIVEGIEKRLQGTNITKFVIGLPSFNGYEKQSRFFRMMDFRLLEQHFIKDVKNGQA